MADARGAPAGKPHGDVASREPTGPSEAPSAAAPTPSGRPAAQAADGHGLASDAAALVPEWLLNLAALGWRLLAIAGLALVALVVADILWTVTASIAVAVIVAAVFAPLVLRLRDNGRSRSSAAAIVWVAAIGTIAAALLLVSLALLPDLAQMLTLVDSGVSRVQEELASLQVPAFLTTLVGDLAEALRGSSGIDIGAIVASAAEAVTVLILATFLLYYFLRDGDKAWVWAFQSVAPEKRERITAAGDDALTRVGGYLRGTTLLSAVIALTDLLFMIVLGVPLALPLAILVFLAGYVPYFGGIVTTVIILVITLAAVGPLPALVLLVLIGLRNVFLGYGIRPAVYGRSVAIHPALVLMALPAGYQIAGIVGLFAAVPVTAVIIAVAGAVVAIVEPDPRPDLPGLVPAWVDRMAQFSWRALVVIGVMAVLVAVFTTIPLVLVPIVLATILAATFRPLVDGLLRRGWARGRAAAVVVGGVSLSIGLVLVLATFSLVEQAVELGASVTAGARAANDAAGGLLELPSRAVADGAGDVVRIIAQVVDAFGAVAVVTVLSVLLAFYFLRDGGRLWAQGLRHLRPDVVDGVGAAAARAFDVLGGYMIGTAAISFVGAASQWLIMVVLGLPLALPVFVLSFILGFIPYIGGFISTGIAFLVTVAVGSTTDILVMAGWTVLFNIVTGNVVAPQVYGRTVHIHPAIVLLAIPAGSAIAGILGMFIVVPALGVVSVTWRALLAALASRPLRAARAIGSPGHEQHAAHSSFDDRADEWDTPERQERARAVAAIIRAEVPLDGSMRAIEIGAGTGLLGLELRADVASMTLSDPSSGMIEVARGKVAAAGLADTHAIVGQVPGPPPPGAPFDLAISLLALHHVEHTEAALRSIHDLLAPGGYIALLDLEAEDGSFHDPDADDIHHHGFDPSELIRQAQAIGFEDVRSRSTIEIERDGRNYPVFLLTGRRP